MAGETSEDLDALAIKLFKRATPTCIWAAADHGTQLYFRKEAARKLQQRYTTNQQFLIDKSH
jgi:hypothetical protein